MTPDASAARALQPVETATCVRVVGGRTLMTDGPFADTKEVLGGALPGRGGQLGRGDRAGGAHPGRPARRRGGGQAGGAALTVLEEVFRDEWGRVLASLVGFLGDFDKAEDAAQEAFAIAAQRWPVSGVPANPGAWLVTTARNRAIDRIRRERTLAEKIHLLPVPEAVMDEFDDTVIKDERLELIFTCCHPALPLDGQVALTLRALGGLQTAEIARAFLVSEETMKRRLTRAKAKIKATGIPFAVPDAHLLPDRVDAVLAVIYLIYNEGYSGRVDLGAEAIRLGQVLAALHAGRAGGTRAARADDDPPRPAAGPVLRRGSRAARRSGPFAVGHATRSRRDGRCSTGRSRWAGAAPYVVQAAIASLQTRERIDWPQVAELYRRLVELTGSPVVELNRAAALAQAGDPAAALARGRWPRPGRLPLLPLDPRRAAAAARPRRRGPRGVPPGARAGHLDPRAAVPDPAARTALSPGCPRGGGPFVIRA